MWVNFESYEGRQISEKTHQNCFEYQLVAYLNKSSLSGGCKFGFHQHPGKKQIKTCKAIGYQKKIDLKVVDFDSFVLQ